MTLSFPDLYIESPAGGGSRGLKMNIGEAAKKSGLSVKTVRFYSDIGLISPDKSTESNYRIYSNQDVEKLLFVGKARKFDFSIEECRELLSLYENKERPSSEVKKITLKKIEEIATLSGVNKFADKLPEKLHTVVGESGIKLSGGQRQRIAIARALIKNAPILVMDEATSSLDNMTEREIQKALDELMKDKTTIIIAHRLSTIKDADIIFTINNGKIENKGNHEHLMENSAVYKKLQLQENSNEN